MEVSPDGRWVAVGGPFNRAVTLWDAANEFQESALPIPGGNCKGIAFSHDGKQVATLSSAMGHERPTVVVWDLATRRQVRSWQAAGLGLGGIVFFTPDGKILLTGGQTEGLYRWDLADPAK
jgi:WD40 repeat protein